MGKAITLTRRTIITKVNPKRAKATSITRASSNTHGSRVSLKKNIKSKTQEANMESRSKVRRKKKLKSKRNQWLRVESRRKAAELRSRPRTGFKCSPINDDSKLIFS